MEPRRPTYRMMLEDELAVRKMRNSAYSMRSFARDLKVSVALLSSIIGGTRNLSTKRAEELVLHLDWPFKKRQAFCLLVRLDGAKTSSLKQKYQLELSQLNADDLFQDVEVDVFHVMSEWYYSAMIELITLEGFNPSPVWIGQQLGISEVQAALALERLRRIGFIKTVGDTWELGTSHISTGDVPSTAIRKFHRQMLKKAEASLEGQSILQRDVSGVTVAIDSRKLGEAKELIARFRRDLVALVNTGDKDKVYHLAVQFFAVTPP